MKSVPPAKHSNEKQNRECAIKIYIKINLLYYIESTTQKKLYLFKFISLDKAFDFLCFLIFFLIKYKSYPNRNTPF